MSLLAILVPAAVFLAVAYRVYGGILARLFQLDDAAATPAVTPRDDVDYEPIPPALLLGHGIEAEEAREDPSVDAVGEEQHRRGGQQDGEEAHAMVPVGRVESPPRGGNAGGRFPDPPTPLPSCLAVRQESIPHHAPSRQSRRFRWPSRRRSARRW